MAFGERVRNYIDLVDEGAMRILRVTRKGTRRKSLSEYALLPRALTGLLHGCSLPDLAFFPIQASGAREIHSAI